MKLKTKVYVLVAILIILLPYYDKPITITLPSLKQIVSTVIQLVCDVTESSCTDIDDNGKDSSSFDTNISSLSETSWKMD